MKIENHSQKTHNRTKDVQEGEMIIDLELDKLDAMAFDYDIDDLGNGKIVVHYWQKEG